MLKHAEKVCVKYAINPWETGLWAHTHIYASQHKSVIWKDSFSPACACVSMPVCVWSEYVGQTTIYGKPENCQLAYAWVDTLTHSSAKPIQLTDQIFKCVPFLSCIKTLAVRLHNVLHLKKALKQSSNLQDSKKQGWCCQLLLHFKKIFPRIFLSLSYHWNI